MKELLGTLIPLLMSGAGIGDVLRQLGGSGLGASTTDGLSAVMSSSLWQARMRYPMSPRQDTITSAAEVIADKMGINPYSGAGQGFASLLGAAYHVAPDVVGSIIGVPNGSRFFRGIANSASGISSAAGYGTTDVVNPYSVMASHKRSMDLGKMVYDLGVRPEGGYNVSYTHGLNMDEMGKVTQRLLSSDVAYQDDSGNRIDPSADSEKFKKRLEKLGSKFNEAASMLTKVTGSIDETLKVMDNLAGGNFLGGTEREASEVANRAKRMAAAIRITSAMAGTSPTEAYSNMQGLMTTMSKGMGMSPEIASASGFSALLGDMAYIATMGYNAWAATHPNASPMQKSQALLAVNGRAQAYASSNGAAFSAAIADNANLFTEEERKRIEESLRSGRPNDVLELVRSRIGENTFQEYMTNPAMQVAARNRAMQENPDFMKNLDQAGMEGNLAQVEAFGAKRMLDKYLSDIDEDLSERSGKSGYADERDKAVKERLVELAVKKGGMTATGARKMELNDLRRALQDNKDIDNDELEKIENSARISAAKGQIDSMRMSSKEEYDARQTLIQAISGSRAWSQKKKDAWIRRINEGGNLEEIATEFSGNMNANDRNEFMKRTFNGKYSASEADRRKSVLDRVEKTQRPEYTLEERMRAIERDSARAEIGRSGKMKGLVAGEDFGKLSGSEAMDKFSEVALSALGVDKERFPDRAESELGSMYEEAARRVVSGVFGGKLGDLEGRGLEELEGRLSGEVVRFMKEGKTVSEAFTAALGTLTDEERGKIGQSGLETVNKMKKDAATDKRLTNKEFFSSASSVVDERTNGRRAKALADMKKIAGGDFGDLDDKSAFERFMDLAKEVGGLDVGDDELKKIREEGLKSIGTTKKDGTKFTAMDAINAAGGKLKKGGIRGGTGFFAQAGTSGADKAGVLMAATFFKLAGGDISRLGLDDETVQLLSDLDVSKADSSMNAISNALNGGGGPAFRKGAVASVEKRMQELGAILGGEKGINKETVQKALAGGEDEMKQLESALSGRADSKSDIAFLRTLNEKKYGNRSAIDVMYEGKDGIKKAKEWAGDKYEEQTVGIARESARKDSDAYKIMEGIGELIKSPLFSNPVEFLNGSGKGLNVNIVSQASPLKMEGT